MFGYLLPPRPPEGAVTLTGTGVGTLGVPAAPITMLALLAKRDLYETLGLRYQGRIAAQESTKSSGARDVRHGSANICIEYSRPMDHAVKIDLVVEPVEEEQREGGDDQEGEHLIRG